MAGDWQDESHLPRHGSHASGLASHACIYGPLPVLGCRRGGSAVIHARSTEIQEVPKLAKNNTLDLALGQFNLFDWEERLFGDPVPEPTPIFHALWDARCGS